MKILLAGLILILLAVFSIIQTVYNARTIEETNRMMEKFTKEYGVQYENVCNLEGVHKK